MRNTVRPWLLPRKSLTRSRTESGRGHPGAPLLADYESSIVLIMKDGVIYKNTLDEWERTSNIGARRVRARRARIGAFKRNGGESWAF